MPGPTTSTGDDRAVSEVLGFVLVVALVVLTLVLLQAFAVPAWNADVEVAHNADVQGDAVDLRGAIMATAGFGNERSTSIELGTRYPGRYLFVNPPPASGTIETTEPDVVAVENVQAFGHANARAFWSTSDRHERTTRFLQYRPDYAEYRNAPTTRLEHGTLYNQFDEDVELVRASRDVVDDNRITLIGLEGDLSETAVTERAIDTTPVSAPTHRTVVGADDDGENVTVELPTRLGLDMWEGLLADEIQGPDNPDGNVLGLDIVDGEPYDRLVLELDPEERYELRMAKVGVADGVSRAPPAYIVTEGRSTAPPTEEVVVQVRDEYGNPAPGAEVDLDLVEGQCADLPRTERADDAGRVVVRCDAVATLEASIVDGDAAYESVEIRFGTPVEVDGTTPTITASTTAVTQEFDVRVPGQPPGQTPPEPLSQVTVDYTTADEVSGVARVFLAVYDGGGETADQVTATTHSYETVGEHEGRWVTPWLFADEDEVGDYEVRIRVVDHAGNTIQADDCTLSTDGTISCP